jgi:hypothetical protein
MPTMNMDTLAKILAKAENTDNEAESESFMQRARQMAAAMGVELDMVRAHAQSQEKQVPEERKYKVGDYGSRYNQYMAKLFSGIAYAYEMRLSMSTNNMYVWATGFPSDHEIIDALFQVAAVKMVDDANRALKRGDQKKARSGYGVDGRVYRAHFYEGYINTFRARLYEERRNARREYDARMKAEKEARGEFVSPYIEDESETDSTAVVLADKRKTIDDAYEAANPHWYHPDGSPKGNVLTHSWNERNDYVGDAQRAGSDSARRTNLRTSKKVDAGSQGAIGG